jgi:hypothetical protein
MNDDFRLEINAETGQGRYTNLAVVSHTGNEFVFDFALSLPNQPALVISRLLTSPQHAKAFLRALQENVAHYEASFGIIEEREARMTGSSTQTN